MNETRLTATLPQLDVEIVHREETDPAHEVLTLRIRATPTFEAVADHLASALLPAVALPSFVPLSSPMAWWTDWMLTAWRPWFALTELAMGVTAATLPARREPAAG